MPRALPRLLRSKLLLRLQRRDRMNCWHCGVDLIWGGDHDCEDDEDHSIVTNLSCPKCNSLVFVYYPREEDSVVILS